MLLFTVGMGILFEVELLFLSLSYCDLATAMYFVGKKTLDIDQRGAGKVREK